MTKLADLHPEHGATNQPGRFHLSFDCQTTQGCRVQIYFHRGPQEPGVWQCTSPFRVFPGLEHLGECPDIARLTLVPSIGDHIYKRNQPRCQGHVSIINGEMLP